MKNSNYWRTRLLCGCVAPILAGCANVSHVMICNDTHLGIKGGLSPATNCSSISIGYRNRFATVIPKIDRSLDPTHSDFDAASVLMGNHAVLHGLDVPDVEEIVATGQTAIEIAKNPSNKCPFTAH